jgi:U3 small nucleolar RNA-associated protein 16
MVTTRRSSHSAEQIDDSTPIRLSKRKSTTVEASVSNGKKRKIESVTTQPSPAASKQSTRIRFGSEEPIDAPIAEEVRDNEEDEDEDQDEDEEDSDDEAPEDISASAAQRGAELAASAKARAIEQYV